MTTRRAKDDSIFHQNRYASSPEFERGLLASMVAKRVSILDDKANRELLWFLQYLSHQEGGMAAVAAALLSQYPDRIGTKAMIEIGKGASKTYNADEVRRIRKDLPSDLRRRFPLRGETNQNHVHRALMVAANELLPDSDRYKLGSAARFAEEVALDREQAAKRPNSYPVAVFLDLCRRAAERGFDYQTTPDSPTSDSLEKELCRLCLNPGWNMIGGGPWYFAGLVPVLRDFHKHWVDSKSAAVVVTALGKKVCEILDYTLYSRSLSLMEGTARTGKSFAARTWCFQHPGVARFVEVPPSNDESSFFRALARGLGLGSSIQYKLGELRERVESVLLTGDLLLVLDEAHRLWPQRNLRYCFPHRINWVMAMTNAGVPICMVSTQQFIEWQKSAEEKGGWNSAQLTGRIGHYELLPASLDVPDLMAVGKAILPEAGKDVLRALAAYARTSARYLAAVDSIAKRAKYIAQRAGRTQCTADDVRTAMQESVIPSDTRLVRTLENTRKNKSGRRASLPAPQSPLLDSPPAEVSEVSNPRNKSCRSVAASRVGELIPG
jgi:hypothetical protein